jgi:Tfp pilus assembly protein PilO
MDKSKKQFITWGAIVVGIAALWFFLIFSPNYSAIKKLNGRKQELLATMGREIRTKEINDLRSKLDSLDVLRKRQEDRLYPQAELIRLGDFLKTIGQESGLTLRGVTPDYEMIKNLRDPQQEVNTLTVVVEYRGLFPELTAFLDQMDDFSYYFKVNEYQIDFAEEGKPELRIFLTGQMFLKRPGSETNRIANGKQSLEDLSMPLGRQ